MALPFLVTGVHSVSHIQLMALADNISLLDKGSDKLETRDLISSSGIQPTSWVTASQGSHLLNWDPTHCLSNSWLCLSTRTATFPPSSSAPLRRPRAEQSAVTWLLGCQSYRQQGTAAASKGHSSMQDEHVGLFFFKSHTFSKLDAHKGWPLQHHNKVIKFAHKVSIILVDVSSAVKWWYITTHKSDSQSPGFYK